jgi:hypothetical protein
MHHAVNVSESGSIPEAAANSWPVMRLVAQPLCLSGESGAKPLRVTKQTLVQAPAHDGLVYRDTGRSCKAAVRIQLPTGPPYNGV